MTVTICKECRSDKVEEKRWVNPNTLEVGDVVSEFTNVGWCRICADETTLVHENDYEEGDSVL